MGIVMPHAIRLRPAYSPGRASVLRSAEQLALSSTYSKSKRLLGEQLHQRPYALFLAAWRETFGPCELGDPSRGTNDLRTARLLVPLFAFCDSVRYQGRVHT